LIRSIVHRILCVGTAEADMSARTFPAITCQPIELVLFKPFKTVESHLASIKKSGQFCVWTFFGVLSWVGGVQGTFRWLLIRAWETNSRGNLFVFFFKKTRWKYVSLEPLIGLLALMVGKFWPKNTN